MMDLEEIVEIKNWEDTAKLTIDNLCDQLDLANRVFNEIDPEDDELMDAYIRKINRLEKKIDAMFRVVRI